MQHPCPPGPQKPRTMAAVSPLHQVAQSQPNLAAYEAANSLNAFGASQRTSSFAAALRKLAKQAGDPITGEKDIAQISPVSSPALAQRSLTPKRNGPNSGQPQPMYLSSSNGHQVTTSYASSSPPVVTIAPSRPHPAHTSDSRKLQVMDLTGMSQCNSNSSNSLNNGQIADPISLKLDVGKSSSRSSAGEKWEDHVNKSLPTSSVSSQSRPHATIAPLPRPDDSLTSSRGFQPYRSAEDIRTTIPHHLSPFDHHPQAAYPYTPAFLPPPHLPHPAYRFDDPLFLDRYGLLRSSVMPFPTQPTMMAAAPAAFYPQSRYDLLAQSLSLSNSSLLHQERLKLEEERRQREKEVELDQSRKREQERREKEQKEKEFKEREHKEKDRKEKEKSHRDRSEHTESNNKAAHHMKRNECHPARRNDTSISGAVNHSSPPVTTSTAPLNLVVHPSPEQHKREAELWVPWQQSQSNHYTHHAKDNHEEPVAAGPSPYRPPSFPQENHKLLPPKDSISPEKFHAPYNLPYFCEKKHQNTDVSSLDADPKKHFALNATAVNNSNTRKFDLLHHHITELSKKDCNLQNEWKHEKLQKACTNNHRKNVTEVKKLREEAHQQNNTHQSTHQRKTVNGLINNNNNNSNNNNKQVLNQDEGMHARLLETEKCRIEYNSHSTGKTLLPNEKMIAPSLTPNNGQVNGKDVNTQQMYIEHHLMSSLKKGVEAAPVRSKLDKEAEDMKNKGLGDVDYDEPCLKDFLIITKMPTLPLDTNPKKMRYLKLLGLTSRLKRKKIELDIYLKRRKVLQEDDRPLPLELEEEEESTKHCPLLDAYSNLEKLSVKLRSEAAPGKGEFLANLGLNPLTAAQKEEKAKLRKAAELERIRRDQRRIAKAKKKSSPPSSLSTKNENEDVKQEDSANEENASKAVSASPSAVSASKHSQNAAIQGEQVPYTKTQAKEEPAASFNHALVNSKASDFTSPQDVGIIKRNGKFRNKFSFKRGHSLKCEWKPSMLALATQNNRQFIAEPSLVKEENKTKFHTTKSTATQVDLIVNCKNSCDKNDPSCKSSFCWPGLEVIIEAYYRHNKEQLMEKDVLKERCNQLRSHQEDLTKEANHLSKSMSTLLKLKRDLEEMRVQHEQAIEKLKKFLQAAR